MLFFSSSKHNCLSTNIFLEILNALHGYDWADLDSTCSEQLRSLSKDCKDFRFGCISPSSTWEQGQNDCRQRSGSEKTTWFFSKEARGRVDTKCLQQVALLKCELEETFDSWALPIEDCTRHLETEKCRKKTPVGETRAPLVLKDFAGIWRDELAVSQLLTLCLSQSTLES